MRFIRSVIAITVVAVISLSGAGAVMATEIIKNFRSDIWIQPDASLQVRETITVVAEGKKIKRGIFRDFPTDYKDQYGNKVQVGFELQSVKKDGQSELFRIVKQNNGVRIYIGDKDVFLRPGTYTYILNYTTTRQIGFFDEFDEVYWNVTGNGWAFEIETASGRVHLPQGASVQQATAYTGYQGERGSLYRSKTFSDGIEYITTRPLLPSQGLTIAVSWPVGFVAKPTEAQKAASFLNDNRAVFVGLGGIAALLLYYLAVWWSVGRDPEQGPVIALYEPPKGYSPAAMRYITKMRFDNKIFSAAIVSMAVKGYLVIEESSAGTYTLRKTGDPADLSSGEKGIANELFLGGRQRIELVQSNHKTLGNAKNTLRTRLRTEFEKIYFNKNTSYFIPGIALSLLLMAAIIFLSGDQEATVFIAIWLGGWTAGIYFLITRAWRAWQSVRAGGGGKAMTGAVVISLFAIPFVIAEIVVLSQFVDLASPAITVLLVVVQLINLAFYHLLKAPTRLGRKMMDEFAGFAEYLSMAEKDRMNFSNPPDRTPELFERFLPFALALGVEQAWGEQFSGAILAASEGPWEREYRPRWYHGSRFSSHNFSNFSSSLGQGFSSAISSASTAPGSSNGSSGGGSSGGGGGGGGGGGW